MKTIAVILAAGLGNRMNSQLPKQFLKLEGKPIINFSLDAFEKNSNVSEILLVVPKDFVDFTKDDISKKNHKKPIDIIPGGEERYQSCYKAVQHLSRHTSHCKILVHDAARPFVSQALIKSTIKVLNRFDVVCPYLPLTDTVYELDKEFNIVQIPNRKSLYNIQTPQGFTLDILLEAFKKGLRDANFFPTDDCSIVKKYLPNIPIKMIPGDIKNKKITYMEDLSILQL